MPVLGGDIASLRVHEHGVVLGAEEVGDRVPVLGGVEGYDAVDARLELHAAGKAEGIADVDEGAVLLGLDEAHLEGAALSGGADLETPLVAEEEGEGADVGVLLVADLVLASDLSGEVVHHGESGG